MSEQKKSREKRGQSGPVKRAVIGVLSFLMEKWNSMQRETKRIVCVSFAIGMLCLITIFVLFVRLGGVTKELKSVQAVSVSLQDELDRVKSDMENVKSELSNLEPVAPTPTIALTPTKAPTLTIAPTAKPVQEKYVVCVDAGHGDWDGGAVMNVNDVEVRVEKDDNLRMAKLFRAALETYGIEVIMTRETDVYLGLSERARIANAANADALISFHRNAYAGTEEVHGVEFWIHNSRPKDAEELAQSMLDAVMAVGGLENRGVKYGTIASAKENYAINREANMASMIVEFGFISSTTDNTAYDTYGEEYTKRMAKAVYEWLEAQEQAD